MHDDDEERFPRITLWQFLKGAVVVPLAFLESIFGIGLIADLISDRKPHENRPDGGPRDRAWPQPPDRID